MYTGHEEKKKVDKNKYLLMKTDIIIAGVGGQGILSIAACIGMAALENSMHIKQSEVHGMSQRGGAVQSHLRISDREIFSDLIPLGKADLIISVEPMESLRYLPWIAKDGWVVSNTTPVKNIKDYPDTEEIIKSIKLLENHVIVDADKIAREIGSPIYSNMVVLGAAARFINLKHENIESGIRAIFARKGSEITARNLEAFNAGWQLSANIK